MSDLSHPLASMSALKLALAAQQHATTRRLLKAEPIAIIGLACRFPPAADTPEKFWQLLRDGADAAREVPNDRWNIDLYYDQDPAAPGKIYTRYGSFLDQVDLFDPAFFGISPREAAMMDPQQRLLLEVSWESLERAGFGPSSLQGTPTGVFIGMMGQDYAHLSADALAPMDAYTGTGNLMSVAAGRVSYVLGFHGPTLTVDTACSSSLVTVHLACQSLRQAECDMALAGGVNLLLTPHHSVMQSRARMLSPDGRCKAFDAAADGMSRGEGCGIVVLKRLADAVADGDAILAVIRGSAVNHDGRSSGLTVPNGRAQERVIRQALENSGVSPAQVSYVEAHGSGTVLGDPIEVEALGAVYGRQRQTPLLIGSVKTNLGHLESAAGIAGLIKVVLALQHREIPRHLHFSHPNPHIPWSELSISVPTAHHPWPAAAARMAGVSSFGASGTNAHVVLEEAPVLPATKSDGLALRERSCHVLVSSAGTAAGLKELAQRYEGYLAANPEVALSDVAYTASVGRSHFANRLSVASTSVADCRQKLAGYIAGKPMAGVSTGEVLPAKPKIAFLFAGQGAQHVNMGRQLYETHAGFRKSIDHCDALLRDRMERPLLQVLYPNPAEANGTEVPPVIDATAYAQPALFALEYALATLWQSWGVHPEVVMGHSSGEFVAACVAGVLSLEDGLTLIAERARLIQSVASGGATAAVFASADRVEALLADFAGSINVAAVNGPEETMIAGSAAEVDRALETWKGIGIDSRRLRISHAPHSPLIEPALPSFERTARTLTYHTPRIKLISNVTGELLTHIDATYWRRHMREPVQFAAGMQQLQAENCDVMLEIGPHPVLLWLGRQNWRAPRPACWLPSLWGIRSDWEQLLESIGELYVRGADIDWTSFYRDENRRKITLPTYPFQRQRYWVQTAPPSQNHSHHHPLLGRRMHSDVSRPDEIQFESLLSANNPPYLGGHCVDQKPVLPAAVYMEIACKAAESVLGTSKVAVENTAIHRPLVLDHAGLLVHCRVSPEPNGYHWRVYAAAADQDDSEWTLYAEGQMAAFRGLSLVQIDSAVLRTEVTSEVDLAAFYDTLESRHLQYGPEFRLIKQLWRAPGRALGHVRLSENLEQDESLYRLHPALLDACFQVSAALLLDVPDTYLPIGVERIEYVAPSRSELLCDARLVVMHPDAPSVDLRLLTNDGELVANIHGLQLKRANPSAPGHDWEYQVVWQPRENLTAVAATGTLPLSRWLIFSDDAGMGEQLAARLRKKHATAILVLPGAKYARADQQSFRIDPSSKSDYEALLAECPEINGVVYGWSGTRDQLTDTTAENVEGSSLAGCASLLYLVQTIVNLPEPPQLWLVTNGAVAYSGSDAASSHLTLNGLVQSPVWGLAKVIAIEHPELHAVRVDLDPGASLEDSVQMLLEELTSPPSGVVEDQVAFRSQRRYAARLGRLPDRPESTPVRLRMTSRGSLDRLRLEPLERRPPQAHEVEIRVRAAGLNFRDVLNVLGMYPGDPGSVGNECAGEVIAVGAAVTALKVGDQVIALVDDAFSHYVTVPCNRVVAKPAKLSFEEAATIPIAFLTAAYCLDQVAKIQPGERVLIHTATGGFGQAAIQLAQDAKAEIFATASRDKWAVLRGLGVEHIYDSRTLDFGSQVLADTGGKGVDIVLNTLTGPGFIERNLAVLSSNGRFVEVSKRDVWSRERIASARRDVAYDLVDLAEMTAKQPDVVQSMLQRLMPRFQDGVLSPLLRTCFPLSEVVSAFRCMLQARHTGKIVVVPSELQPLNRHGDGTYLITGGLGGLGLLMARWLIERGAKHVALLGRHAPRPEAQLQLDELNRLGAVVTVLKADISDTHQASRALASIDPAHPLRGIIHAAGVLDDGALVNQDVARFKDVLAPKIQGGWNLHVLTKDMPLDFFILFSSVASLLGSAGQGNHAAANAFLDTLAHYRHALGLPALAINWGAWSEIGVAAPLVSQIRRLGLGAISPAEGQQILDRLWPVPSAQVGVIPIDWTRYHAKSPFLSDFQQVKGVERHKSILFIQQLKTVPDNQRRHLLIEHIRVYVAQILGHQDSNAISTTRGFRELGMDSLTSLELRNRLQTSLNCQLPPGLVFNHPSVEAVAEYVVQHVIDKRVDVAIDPPAQAAVPEPASPPPPNWERRLDCDGLSLCVCEWGPASGSPVVCLHGTRDHGASWETVAGVLAARGHKVIAPDLRGHGRSGHHGPLLSYQLQDFVSDINAVLRQPGLAPVTLVAHSLGSIIAVLAAAAHPERISGLVLVEPPLPPGNNGGRPSAAHLSFPDAPLQSAIMSDLDVAAERLRQVTPNMPYATALRMATRLTTTQAEGLVWSVDSRLDATYEWLLAGLGREQYLNTLAGLRMPVAIVFGSSSGWINQADKDRIQLAARDARAFVLPGGHNLHLESGTELAAVIMQAIEKVPLLERLAGRI